MAMSGSAPDGVRVTIRRSHSGNQSNKSRDLVVFSASFAHVKGSLSTFLKFWLMGGCGDADGWTGIGELEAKHDASGAMASILVDAEQASVSLVATSEPSAERNGALNQYAVALLDELEALAKTVEAAEADRLCFPPDVIDSARLAAWASLAPREPGGGEDGGDQHDDQREGGDDQGPSEFQRFLQSLK